MRIATSEIMKKIDDYCINELDIPGIVLMENAALKVIKNLELERYNSFCIVCTKGNNGGDGFAVARHLQVLNKKIEVFLVGGKENMRKDCKINYNILKKMGVSINNVGNFEDINSLRDSIEKNDMTIDAVFGTGLSRNIEGIYDSVISIINENSKYIVSIDVPSGLDSNTGKVLGNCIRADKTVSFQLYKKGFLNYGTDKLTGKIIVEDIGIPETVINKFHNDEFIIDETMVRDMLQIRDKYSHKGDYGRVLVIAGSKGYTGAAYICTQGAIRSGAGLVTLCCSNEIRDILSSKFIEAMTISFDDENKLNEAVKRSNAIAIGPGMGNNELTLKMLNNIINNSSCPIIIDADGINVLKDRIDILKNKKSQVVITPHLGEMSKITGLSIDYIKQNRIEVSKQFAKENNIVVLLKGFNTIITDGEKTIINSTGNSSMASGGMGDCLTGMIASFVGQGYEPIKAAYIAAYIHGYSGEKLSKNMFCVNASHILDDIPFSIKQIQDCN
ncbi:NAD(P)H-hydrate dehydratase [Clostridiaceae bacterium UIB06]|uniref:Bifunctional NAD(P)H-hydrate repair enzyme n=1 Tax=Clostridium thailandense TaxID=2794346 RepID=A0A949TQW1_9CLOT|nr:NAD(P)H-hydrate dehydratase [Clostridium thailandense]MBV7271586.1 NAD(P)H-hydrate dehydratase [Clostridium thailandense]MCH5136444.1 NAD(P)H-hydrate dehydratase [Clostridiaceae bacterium UIB06]